MLKTGFWPRNVLNLTTSSSNSRGRARRFAAPRSSSDGPNWTDAQIAEAFSCRVQTVENIRKSLMERRFRETLDGAKRECPPIEKILTGDQEAKSIAMRLGQTPEGYANWTLRLLAWKVVELEILESNSHETIRRTLKKTA